MAKIVRMLIEVEVPSHLRSADVLYCMDKILSDTEETIAKLNFDLYDSSTEEDEV